MSLLPKGDYLWAHNQRTKWENIAKEKLRHLDQIIDGHSSWYSAHSTARDIIRTRRALPDPDVASQQPKKRKLVDMEAPSQEENNGISNEDNSTNKVVLEEKDGLENENNAEDENNNNTHEASKGGDLEEEIDKDKGQNMVDNLENKNIDEFGDNQSKHNDDMDAISQTDKSKTSDAHKTSPKSPKSPVKSSRKKSVEVVSKIIIRPTILKSRADISMSEIPEQPSVVNKLLPLNKNEALSSKPVSPHPAPPEPSSSKEVTITTTENANIDPNINSNDNINSNSNSNSNINININTNDNQSDVVDIADSVQVVETGRASHHKTVTETEHYNTTVEVHDIVFSDVMPEPINRFKNKKKTIKNNENKERTSVTQEVSTVSTTTVSEKEKAKVLREIMDDDMDEDESSSHVKASKKPTQDRPSWTLNPEFEKNLERQSRMDPEKIFGPIRPIKLADVFRKKVTVIPE